MSGPPGDLRQDIDHQERSPHHEQNAGRLREERHEQPKRNEDEERHGVICGTALCGRRYVAQSRCGHGIRYVRFAAMASSRFIVCSAMSTTSGGNRLGKRRTSASEVAVNRLYRSNHSKAAAKRPSEYA